MMGVAISIAAVIGLLPELAAINTCREERSYIVINRPKEEEGQFINKFVLCGFFFPPPTPKSRKFSQTKEFGEQHLTLKYARGAARRS